MTREEMDQLAVLLPKAIDDFVAAYEGGNKVAAAVVSVAGGDKPGGFSFMALLNLVKALIPLIMAFLNEWNTGSPEG